MKKLDVKDKKILNILQNEDMLTPKINKIAEKLKIPASVVHGRIKNLESNGVILNYKAMIDPKKVGKGFIAFIFGEPKYSKNLNWDETAKKLEKIKGVQEIFFVSGQDDFLIKIRTQSVEDYSKTAEEIAKILNKNAHGMIAPKTFYENTAY